MLSYIMGLVQAFEYRHGFRPQMVCLNPRHLHQLLVEFPDIDHEKFFGKFGVRILVLPENDLPHPCVEWLPSSRPRVEARPAIDRSALHRAA
ncbi:hypothetical protein [Sulfuricaulis sp.]|uniref:hypothetical protein n=1 Tax=Sulfuricaulis sp. TaxID=2003553 RepID=UPI0035595F6C